MPKCLYTNVSDSNKRIAKAIIKLLALTDSFDVVQALGHIVFFSDATQIKTLLWTEI